MIDFIDKTSDQNGTPLNRSNLMAVQGFQTKTTIFQNDGSIVETDDEGRKLTTTFGADGSVIETFTGEKTITKTTTYNSDGSISEVIS